MKKRDQDPSTLLQYTISTDPSPVSISSDNSPVTAEIDIQVAADLNILCKYIAVEIPIGDGATDLYEPGPAPTARSNNSDWELSTDNVHGMVDDDGDNFKNFLFKHISDDMTVDTAVTFSITGTVNKQSGTTLVTIKEDSIGIDDDTYSIKPITQNISKMGEEAFYLNAAVVCYVDTPDIPVALLDKNRGFQLQWQSNGDSFIIFPGGTGEGPINLDAQTYYQVGNGITTDTTYIIQAQKGGEYLYLEYVAKVNTPNAAFNDLSAIGSLQLLGSMTEIYEGTHPPFVGYNPTSDGFIIIMVFENSGNSSSVAIAGAYVGEFIFSATSSVVDGGNPTTGNVIVPIQKSNEFYLYFGGDPDDGSIAKYYWLPFGNGELKETNPMPASLAGKIDEHSNKIKKGIAGRRAKALDFITAFEEAFDKKLKDEVREQLIKKMS